MSGRYTWGVGFYNMQSKSKTNGFSDSFHCIAPEIPLLPALLKQQGCACTHLYQRLVSFRTAYCFRGLSLDHIAVRC